MLGDHVYFVVVALLEVLPTLLAGAVFYSRVFVLQVTGKHKKQYIFQRNSLEKQDKWYKLRQENHTHVLSCQFNLQISQQYIQVK